MWSELVVPLSSVSIRDRGRVGAKAAHLGELLRAGLPVPCGFVVEARAYRAHLEAHGLLDPIRALLARIDFADPSSVELGARALRALVVGAPVAPPLATAIERSYAALGGAVAVRSSATAEDLPGASFAGQQESWLDVAGAEAVVARVRDCWSSVWTPRALAYRQHRGLPHLEVDVACLVQAMVSADFSGVLFTLDPTGGDPDRAVVDAIDGLGAPLVSGTRTADQFALSRSRRSVVAHRPGDARGAAALAPRLPALLALCLEVEARLGVPQDVEWAMRGGRPYLLQARPITAAAVAPVSIDRALRPIYGQSLKIQEILPGALPPACGDVFADVIFPTSFRALGAEGLLPRSILDGMARSAKCIRGRVYVDVSALREMFLPGLDEATALDLLEEGRRPAWSAIRWRAVATLALRLPATSARLLRFLASMEQRTLDLEGVVDDVLRAWQVPPFEEAPWPVLVDVVRLRPPVRGEDFLRVSTVNPVAAFVSTLAWGLLCKLLARWTREPPESAARLVSGLSGILDVECSKALWSLARQARALPELAARLEEDPARALDRLPSDPAAAAWLREWQAFLDRYGHRTVEELDLSRPRWREDPSYPLSVVANYLRAAPAADPLANEGRLRDERLATEGRILDALAGRPLRRALFARVLRILRVASITRQNSKFHMVRGFDLMRRALLEMGRRLVAGGQLNRIEEVFLLHLDELEGRPEGDLRPVVERRRPELARWQGERPCRLQDASGRPVREGVDRPAPPAATDGTLRGIGTSPGRVRGRVRVVRDASRGARVEPGEILVAPFTDPSWTPLFPCATAVVVEVGSLLSHASIVARELGIPSVVAVPDATRRLADGAWVEVDGQRGTVTVLAEEGAAQARRDERRGPAAAAACGRSTSS